MVRPLHLCSIHDIKLSEQETENEFPFLEEVYTPPSQSKIEYESPSSYVRERS
jgi:hypothetical protein